MMRPRGQWVVDASVALKWHLRDEQYLTQADVVLSAFASGEVELLAPSFIRYEVANAFLIASKIGRISFEIAREQLRDFLSLSIHQAGDDNALVSSAMELASRLDITVYDALYMELAKQVGGGFVTADRKLYDKVRDTFHEAVWIENVQVSQS